MKYGFKCQIEDLDSHYGCWKQLTEHIGPGKKLPKGNSVFHEFNTYNTQSCCDVLAHKLSLYQSLNDMVGECSLDDS